TNDGVLAGAQNSARDELQDEPVPVENDRMPRVVSARAPRDVIERTRKVVHNLALAFIAPLRTYDNNRLHRPVSPLRTCSGLLTHIPHCHSEDLLLARG